MPDLPMQYIPTAYFGGAHLFFLLCVGKRPFLAGRREYASPVTEMWLVELFPCGETVSVIARLGIRHSPSI